MKEIQNPILTGFNPDPSILRVGDDYYIATSTFEWFPGVQIHHSKDLVHWKLVGHPLKRVSQLNMLGNIPSGGVWAPCLTYDNGTFYLIYTDTKNFGGAFKDTHNYMVTTTDILGDWSEPIYLNSCGFDPSLFHDDDGRKWLVYMSWDYRKNVNHFAGIYVQEFSAEEGRLIGAPVRIFAGTELGFTEGPHLYKRNGYYYLLTAEGGTGYDHAVTFARSETLTGPYEVHPDNPILTSKGKPELALQKAGHADLVETQNGEWYMVHLCGRPLPKNRCRLGRETAIQKVQWGEDGWLRLEGGGNEPKLRVPAPDLPAHPFAEENTRDDFDSAVLSRHFATLRTPLGEDTLSLTERPGYLRLKGRESLHSLFCQSLVARRQQHFSFEASTCVEFEPRSFKQMAGLICMYSTDNFYYLKISHDETMGKCVSIATCDNHDYDEPAEAVVPVNGWKRCYLKTVVSYSELRFYYSEDGENWNPIGGVYDASTLSDEYSERGTFTGAFVGMCCQDLDGTRKAADFDYFSYVPIEK